MQPYTVGILVMGPAGFCRVMRKPYYDHGQIVIDVDDEAGNVALSQPIESYFRYSSEYFEYSRALDTYDHAFAAWVRACAAAGVSLWSDESERLPEDNARHDARTRLVAAGIDLSGVDPYFPQRHNATAESQPERATRLGIDLGVLRQAEEM